ncbi:hypothetical protein [Domibacillus sp.]|uniref:hypothetical protein n=1 Tax=Domibacillus sp. TaxID=1969783 RepID=UPI002811ECC1|nr:hypothetical protein [Domibacillus sp.]
MNQDWVADQSQTTHHKTAIYLFPLVVFLGYLHPILFSIGLIIFFLVTSFKLLKSMLFWMLILGGISAVLPFLAPVIFIIMVVLFIKRIGYVVSNWRPFVAGLLLYGVSGGLIGRSTYLHTYSLLSPSIVIEGVIISVLSFVCLRLLLRWLYQFNYTSYAALGIMGSVPVIIIAFVLPFLKLHIGGDFFSAETTVETKPVSGEAYTETKIGTGEVVATRTVIPTEQPLVHVNDHVRTVPDGEPTNNLSYDGSDKKAPNQELVSVKEHVRTAPDGDPTNNLSYDGPDKRAPNEELILVKEHVRTVPDGDVTNNLSYDGSNKEMLNDELILVEEHVRTVPDSDPTNNLFYNGKMNEPQVHNEFADQSESTGEKTTREKIVENVEALVPGQTAVDQLLRELKKQEDGTSNA